MNGSQEHLHPGMREAMSRKAGPVEHGPQSADCREDTCSGPLGPCEVLDKRHYKPRRGICVIQVNSQSEAYVQFHYIFMVFLSCRAKGICCPLVCRLEVEIQALV